MKRNMRVLWLAGLLMLPVFGVNAQSKYGKDSVACVQNLSLYRDDYSKKKYDDAYPNWKAVLDNCPMASTVRSFWNTKSRMPRPQKILPLTTVSSRNCSTCSSCVPIAILRMPATARARSVSIP